MVENFVRWLPIFISFVQIIFLPVGRGGGPGGYLFSIHLTPLIYYVFIQFWNTTVNVLKVLLTESKTNKSALV